MTILRSYIALLLIAVMTLTGHSMAMARGAPGPSGFMELCTGGGPIMVAVDEHGEPTGASHICPEFSLMLQDAIGGVDAAAAPAEFRSTLICCTALALGTSFYDGEASARGPPTLV